MKMFDDLQMSSRAVLDECLIKLQEVGVRSPGSVDHVRWLCQLTEELCRLVVYVKVCAYRDAVPPGEDGVARLNDLPFLAHLGHPSFGHWLGALRELDKLLAQDEGMPPDVAGALSLSRTIDDPTILMAAEAMINGWQKPGTVQGRKLKLKLGQLLDIVGQLRNTLAHPKADRPFGDIQALAIGPALQDGLIQLIQGTPLLADWRLMFVEALGVVNLHQEIFKLTQPVDLLKKSMQQDLPTRLKVDVQKKVCLLHVDPDTTEVDGLVVLHPFVHYEHAQKAVLLFGGMTDKKPQFLRASGQARTLSEEMMRYTVFQQKHRPAPAQAMPKKDADKYRQHVRTYLGNDGRIDEVERSVLEQSRGACGLSTEEAAAIEREVMTEQEKQGVAAQPPAAVQDVAPPTATTLQYAPFARSMCRIQLVKTGESR